MFKFVTRHVSRVRDRSRQAESLWCAGSDMTDAATSTRPSITVPLLGRYFSVVKEFKTYLSEILEFPSDPSTSTFEPNSTDGPLYHALIDTCYLGINTTSHAKTPWPRFKVFPSMVDMREVGGHVYPQSISLINHRRFWTKLRKSYSGQNNPKVCSRWAIDGQAVKLSLEDAVLTGVS